MLPEISNHEKRLCSSWKHRDIQPNKAALSREQGNTCFLQFIIFSLSVERTHLFHKKYPEFWHCSKVWKQMDTWHAVAVLQAQRLKWPLPNDVGLFWVFFPQMNHRFNIRSTNTTILGGSGGVGGGQGYIALGCIFESLLSEREGRLDGWEIMSHLCPKTG